MYKHLEEFIIYKSLIGNNCQTLFLSLCGNKTQSKQAGRVNQWLVYHWQNDGRLQKFTDNQILCWRILCSQMSFYKAD